VSGVSGWPGARAADFPGVTISSLIAFAPRGVGIASPAVPSGAMYGVAPGGAQLTNPALGLSGGVASGAQVAYNATRNRNVWSCGGPAGANEVSVRGREIRTGVADGPWTAPSAAAQEPSLAVCGWGGIMEFRPGVTAVSTGFGWVIVPGGGGAGFSWLGGPLAAEGSTFQNTGTWPYVILELPPGGVNPLRIRVRGNDGTARFHVPSIAVNPFAPFGFDWRVYRATPTRAARYELRLSGVLAFTQSMSEGAGPGGESASPTATGHGIFPLFWNQMQTAFGAIFQDHWFYTGYDSASTTDREP
jgi:hypothetical protein